ncbi:MAG: non-reducing end alpha-L-arabinofuranosidase, partial [Actinoplanes sp.]|nr:non-reducing end alpha-L-arabinofuranosidase [Actinoplanes sp.]
MRLSTVVERSRFRRLRITFTSSMALTLGVLVAVIALPGTSLAATNLPCDIYGNAGTPCVAAHSTVRALIASYNGPLYQLTRKSDGAAHDVGLLAIGGYANAADHDA